MDAVELRREEREDALVRLRAYFGRERGEEPGELGAILIYDFVAEELGPYFYNKGIEDAQGARRALRRLARRRSRCGEAIPAETGRAGGLGASERVEVEARAERHL